MGDELDKIRAARAGLLAAQDELLSALRAAEVAGETQRAMGSAAGLTHQQVWLLLHDRADLHIGIQRHRQK